MTWTERWGRRHPTKSHVNHAFQTHTRRRHVFGGAHDARDSQGSLRRFLAFLTNDVFVPSLPPASATISAAAAAGGVASVRQGSRLLAGGAEPPSLLVSGAAHANQSIFPHSLHHHDDQSQTQTHIHTHPSIRRPPRACLALPPCPCPFWHQPGPTDSPPRRPRQPRPCPAARAGWASAASWAAGVVGG